MTKIRTRFAPSPTGALHVGAVRTALFAWLLTRNKGGDFLLRIEDTDQNREIEGGVHNIKESLKWLGIEWDEGPDVGGPHGPYIQSERLDVYKQVAEDLIGKGLAYADPYTAEQLQELREKAQAEKKPFLYRDHRPEDPPKWDGSQPLRIRLEPKTWTWKDAVMGDISMGSEMIDDFIIIKSDGFPTYNFCHIVDDHLMKITHVMRSQEFISSIPKFLALQEVLGYDMPVNAITPPVLDSTGKRKLSKRFGAKSILEYKQQGYVPEAMINFIATLGWNDGTEQEIFSRKELIEKFDLSRVQKGGAIADEQRLLWMNGHWIRSFSLDELMNRVEGFWPDEAADHTDDYKLRVLKLVQERLKYFAELPELTRFFFTDPSVDSELFISSKQTKKVLQEDRNELLKATIEQLDDSDFSQEDLEVRLRNLVETLDVKPGTLFGIIRIAITGSLYAPGLFETMNVLGEDTTLRRLKAAIN